MKHNGKIFTRITRNGSFKWSATIIIASIMINVIAAPVSQSQSVVQKQHQPVKFKREKLELGNSNNALLQYGELDGFTMRGKPEKIHNLGATKGLVLHNQPSMEPMAFEYHETGGMLSSVEISLNEVQENRQAVPDTLRYKRVEAKLMTGDKIKIKDAVIMNGKLIGQQYYHGAVKKIVSYDAFEIESVKGSNHDARWNGTAIGGSLGLLLLLAVIAGTGAGQIESKPSWLIAGLSVFIVPSAGIGFLVGLNSYTKWNNIDVKK